MLFAWVAVTCAAALMLVAACSSPESPTTVVTVDVSPDTHTYYAIGDEIQLAAIARDASHEPVSTQTFAWESSDPAVVAISPTGMATAVAAGSATITARAGGVIGTAVLTVDYWRSVTAGRDHTCALTVSGKAYCWGSNSDGQVGSLSFDPVVPEPTAVAGDLLFRQISAGKRITCAVSTGGEAYCWGSLADVSGANSFVPVEVAEGFTFEQISTMLPVGSSRRHACGVTSGGAAVCWGTNAYGQLGDNSTIDRDAAVAVAGGLAFAAVSTGDAHSCGITTTGDGYCWGSGNGSGSAKDSVPTPVRGDSTYSAITSMFQHSCALTPGGAAYCWGAGVFGKLGDGSTNGSISPVAVSGGLGFSTIDAGSQHTCGVTTGGQGYCWGGGWDGALGTGDVTEAHVPEMVTGSLTFVTISAGMGHSCGVRANGAIYCWGWGSTGALGTGGTSGSRSPVRVRDPA
jgi:alpha-tubulin suppressor-like RCC1 family protein